MYYRILFIGFLANRSISYFIRTTTFPKIESASSVHDADRIRVLVEAQGFISYEEEFVGVDLFGGKFYSIGLTPIVVTTDSSP
jgi:hypothetical protein